MFSLVGQHEFGETILIFRLKVYENWFVTLVGFGSLHVVRHDLARTFSGRLFMWMLLYCVIQFTNRALWVLCRFVKSYVI